MCLGQDDDLRPLIVLPGPEPTAREVFARLLEDDRWAVIGAYRDDVAVGYVAAQYHGRISGTATLIGSSG